MLRRFGVSPADAEQRGAQRLLVPVGERGAPDGVEIEVHAVIVADASPPTTRGFGCANPTEAHARDSLLSEILR